MRGGSKGVKNKNIRPLLGRPLMNYTIDCAKQSELLDDIAISSDSQEILAQGAKQGVQHLFLREEHLATDEASKWDVFKDLVLQYESKTNNTVSFLVDLDVTVPRRLPKHIDGAIALMKEQEVEVVITAYEPERNPYFNMMEVTPNGAQLVKQGSKPIVCRQEAPKVYGLTPAVYVIGRKAIFELDHWSKAKCALYPIPRELAVDIDVELDFKWVEFLMKENGK